MKKYCQTIFVLLLCTLFTACNSTSDNEGYHVRGQAFSEFPSPSLVEVSGPIGSFTSGSTDTDGFFSMLVPDPPPYQIRVSSMQSDYSCSPALEAWCESSECYITPWSTLMLRLMGEHDSRKASELLMTATGFGADPFIQQGPIDGGVQEAFLHETFRDLLNGGDLREESGSGQFSAPFGNSCSMSKVPGSQMPVSWATPPPELATSSIPGEGIYVQNAGLVLASDFFKLLFERLGLLSSGREFLNRSAQEDAVYYLQYLATGNANVAERQLVLNKVLTGIDIATPIKGNIEISSIQQDLMRHLLVTITRTWPPMRNTSIDSLQQMFLVRDGFLHEEEDLWVLKVERKAFDFLLQELPWRYSPIYYAWMDKPLIVVW